MSEMLDSLGERKETYGDDVLRDLLERQHLIEEMQQTPGWELWKDFLSEVASGYQNRLLLGTHKDLLDYRYDAGVLQGIRVALTSSDRLEQAIADQRRNLEPITDEGDLP